MVLIDFSPMSYSIWCFALSLPLSFSLNLPLTLTNVRSCPISACLVPGRHGHLAAKAQESLSLKVTKNVAESGSKSLEEQK